jgi:uncharacterized protein
VTRRAIFHLAIPTKDLDESAEFYTALGCRIARRYDDRITMDFFGDQVVCHLNPNKIDHSPEMYPRHFGLTFHHKTDFDQFLKNCEAKKLKFFDKPSVRFKGKKEQHEMFFLIDPSNNLIEFKYYPDPNMIF